MPVKVSAVLYADPTNVIPISVLVAPLAGDVIVGSVIPADLVVKLTVLLQSLT